MHQKYTIGNLLKNVLNSVSGFSCLTSSLQCEKIHRTLCVGAGFLGEQLEIKINRPGEDFSSIP
jgi:hypothetical protein